MSPNIDTEKKQVSFPKLKYPVLRDVEPRTAQQWMKSKVIQDGAEGLWRIHDSLYDFTDFTLKHPGGTYWITSTKGTDITELFEIHHLKGIAEGLLPKYFVRKTSAPRNYPFTFHEDGFYKTLKTKVMKKLKEIPDDERKKSILVTDLLLMSFIVLLPLTAWAWRDNNLLLAATMTFATAYVMSALTTSSHNFIHQADNWRMYIINLSGMTHEDWRIAHSMSHHTYTNTAHDLELSFFEPILVFLPYKHKRIFEQMASFYFPIVFLFVFIFLLLKEVITSAINFEGKKLKWHNLIPFMVPSWIWMTGAMPVTSVLLLWVAILMLASLIFNLYAISAGHHSSSCFFECDIPRQEDLDWGLHQLDSVVERIDIAGDHFRSLTRFGDHALHHLFPTIDHALLKYFYPIFFEHLDKFDTKLRTVTSARAILYLAKQLVRKRQYDFTSEKSMPKHVNTPYVREVFLADLKNN